MPDHIHGTFAIDAENAAARLLGVERSGTPRFERFRNGVRSRAVLATLPGIEHRFRAQHARVVVKLYKGKGDTPGSQGYQRYHHTDFSSIPALVTLADDGRIQRSLSGGVRDEVGPYAVLELVEGEELTGVLDAAELRGREAGRLVSDLLTHVWIPLWSNGLRFKDCHPGNFVVTPDGRLVMIDTEQMRHPARELLKTPTIWTRRDAAERTAIARLPGLLRRIVLAADPSLASATVLRTVKSASAEAELPASLCALGRGTDATPRAHAAAAALLENLRSLGYLG